MGSFLANSPIQLLAVVTQSSSLVWFELTLGFYGFNDSRLTWTQTRSRFPSIFHHQPLSKFLPKEKRFHKQFTQRRSGTSQFILNFQLTSKTKFTHWRCSDIWALIGYMIDTFRKTAPDIYQKVFRKSRIRTSPCHCLILGKLICQSCLGELSEAYSHKGTSKWFRFFPSVTSLCVSSLLFSAAIGPIYPIFV